MRTIWLIYAVMIVNQMLAIVGRVKLKRCLAGPTVVKFRHQYVLKHAHLLEFTVHLNMSSATLFLY